MKSKLTEMESHESDLCSKEAEMTEAAERLAIEAKEAEKRPGNEWTSLRNENRGSQTQLVHKGQSTHVILRTIPSTIICIRSPTLKL
jgi:hypothetical protein